MLMLKVYLIIIAIGLYSYYVHYAFWLATLEYFHRRESANETSTPVSYAPNYEICADFFINRTASSFPSEAFICNATCKERYHTEEKCESNCTSSFHTCVKPCATNGSSVDKTCPVYKDCLNLFWKCKKDCGGEQKVCCKEKCSNLTFSSWKACRNKCNGWFSECSGNCQSARSVCVAKCAKVGPATLQQKCFDKCSVDKGSCQIRCWTKQQTQLPKCKKTCTFPGSNCEAQCLGWS